MTNTTTGTTSTDAGNREPPAPNVWPAFRAADATALIRFLVVAFGFREVVVYGAGDRVDHVELAWPEGGGVMFGSAPAEQDGWTTASGSAAIYVVTEDPDAVCVRARAAGARIAREPRDTD
jgi:uncharacterized glyoxalase superfamily protein PhnB